MRKKQMRRLASALALTMAAGLFTGCGSPAPKEGESASAETESPRKLERPRTAALLQRIR